MRKVGQDRFQDIQNFIHLLLIDNQRRAKGGPVPGDAQEKARLQRPLLDLLRERDRICGDRFGLFILHILNADHQAQTIDASYPRQG